MSADFRTISLQNIPDAIRLMNESSRDTSLSYRLDFFGFLSLARYWDFSYQYSLMCYVDDEPAALMINSTDLQTQDAYTFYWGALPKFRRGKTSLTLFEAGCKKLRDDGYTMLYAVSVPDRPVSRYRFIHLQPQWGLIDMQTPSPSLPAAHPGIEVRDIDAGALSQVSFPPSEALHWCQRHTFLRSAAPFLQFLGAFAGKGLEAYAVVLAQASNTTLLDLRSAESGFEPGYELLRRLVTQNYRPPFSATYVFEGSYAHRLLTTAGFSVTRQFSVLSRDLRVPSSAKATHV